MRVLQLVSDPDRRGAQVFATDLHRALAVRGADVHTVALAAGSSSAPLELPTLSGSASWLSGLPGLRRAAAGVDVVVAHGSTTLPACALALGRRTPWVYRSIGDLPRWVGTGWRRRRVRAMLRRARGVSVLWPDLVPFVRDELGIDQVRVLPNAVAADRFPVQDAQARARARADLELAPDRPVIAHIGALSPEKCVDRVIDGAAALDASLVVAGDGPLGDELQRRAGAHVRFVGSVADPTPVYAAADVVALASTTEGQPAVIIEAALSGRAVVAPRVGGVGELIDDGRTGVLYDDPADFADALRAGLQSAAELGVAAPAWARARFDLDVVADAWSEWLAELV